MGEHQSSSVSHAQLPAGYVDVLPAERLANLIATARTALVVLVLVVGIVLGVTSGASLWPPVLVGLAAALTIHVTFGWLEQTLRLLVGIARNTAEAAGVGPSTPTSDEVADGP